MDLSGEREEAGQGGDFHVEACLWASGILQERRFPSFIIAPISLTRPQSYAGSAKSAKSACFTYIYYL